MSVSYIKLWHKLLDMHMSLKEFSEMAGISRTTVDRMRNNQMVSVPTLCNISNVLGCEIEDIMEYKKD